MKASGKFVLRLDPEVHQALKTEARACGESLNTLCNRKLQSRISAPPLSALGRIIEAFKPLAVVLFGSVARGEATAKSDIDLLIVMPETQSISRDLYQRWDKTFGKSENQYSPQFVHLLRLEGEIGSIWLEVGLDGEILYDPERIMKNIFIKVRSQIAEGRYLRKSSHGHAYWVRRGVDAK